MIPATGSCRKTPEIAGTWTQYSDRKSSGFFRWIPVNFLCFPAETGQNTAFTKSPELPGTGSFRTGLFDLGKFETLQCAGYTTKFNFCKVHPNVISMSI
jgi:hypothetical protein